MKRHGVIEESESHWLSPSFWSGWSMWNSVSVWTTGNRTSRRKTVFHCPASATQTLRWREQNGFPPSIWRAAIGKSMYIRITRRRQRFRQVGCYAFYGHRLWPLSRFNEIWVAHGNSPGKSQVRRMTRVPGRRDYNWPYIPRAPPQFIENVRAVPRRSPETKPGKVSTFTERSEVPRAYCLTRGHIDRPWKIESCARMANPIE
jgi:hypothetical protein